MFKAYLATATAYATGIAFEGDAAAGSSIYFGWVTQLAVDDRFDTRSSTGVTVHADAVETDAALTLTFEEVAVAGVSFKPLSDYDYGTSQWLIPVPTDGLQITLGDADEPCFTVPAGIHHDYYFNVWDECAGTASSITFTMPYTDADTVAEFALKYVILHDSAQPYTYLFKDPWAYDAEYGVFCNEDMTASAEEGDTEYTYEFDASYGDDGLTVMENCFSDDLYMTDFMTTLTTEEGVLADAVAVEGTDFYYLEQLLGDDSGYLSLYFFLFSDQPPTESQREALFAEQEGYVATQYSCYDIDVEYGDSYSTGEIQTYLAASAEECNKLAFLAGSLYSGHQSNHYAEDNGEYYCYYFAEMPDFTDVELDGSSCLQLTGTGLELEEDDEGEDELSATKFAASAATMLLASANLF